MIALVLVGAVAGAILAKALVFADIGADGTASETASIPLEGVFRHRSRSGRLTARGSRSAPTDATTRARSASVNSGS